MSKKDCSFPGLVTSKKTASHTEKAMKYKLMSVRLILLITILTCCAVISINGHTISIWLSTADGYGYHGPIYYTNEIVYVSGDWDIADPIFPIGYIYMVSNDRSTWTGNRSIGNVYTRKTIQGLYGFGAFYGEILKLPPLLPGEYDVVMDEDQDEIYHQGIDYILGNGTGYALKVIDQTLDQDVDVAAIKADAAQQANEWRRTNAAFQGTFRVISLASTAFQAVDLATSFGLAYGFAYTVVELGASLAGIPTSYNGFVMDVGGDLIENLCLNTAAVHDDIAADPPDYNYDVLVVLSPVGYEYEISSNDTANACVRLSNNLAEQEAVGNGFLHSYEKFLGAEEEEAYEYAMLQARSAHEYCTLNTSILTTALAHLDSLETAIDAEGWADKVFDADEARTIQQRVISSGFTQDEVDGMVANGMTLDEITASETAITEMDLTELTTTSYRDLITDLRTTIQPAITSYDAVAVDLADVLDQLQYVWTDHPRAVIAGMNTVNEGTILSLDGSSSEDPLGGVMVYGWDADMDGEFDDGTTGSIQIQFDREGEYLVGLSVENGAEHVDVAYHRVIVTDVNHAPSFTFTDPEDLYLTSAISANISFSVSAEDLDLDPVDYTWYVDDVEVGTGSTYLFEPMHSGLYHVGVRLSDGSSQSPDNYHVWRVRVEGATISASLTCMPESGIVPFVTNVSVTLNNNYAGLTRRVAARLDASLGGGQQFSNWKSGWSNVDAGGSFSRSWNQTIPALGSVIGSNVFSLSAEDVTPSPYNQTPHPPAGDTDSDSCSVIAASP